MVNLRKRLFIWVVLSHTWYTVMTRLVPHRIYPRTRSFFFREQRFWSLDLDAPVLTVHIGLTVYY